MSTTVTLQLNANNVAGDWANRSTGSSSIGTGDIGSPARRLPTRRSHEVAVLLSDFRGAVESIRRGAHSKSIAKSSTNAMDVSFGNPLMYQGIRFAVGR